MMKLSTESITNWLKKILKVIDDTVVPYYRNGVRDHDKMTAAFSTVGVVD